MSDLSRLCIHTMTTKPLGLADAVGVYRDAGVPAITVWRQALQPQGLEASARLLRESGLRVTSLCRGGFFPGASALERSAAIDDNRRAIDEAHAIGAPMVVLVPGAVPGMPLAEGRCQVRDGIEAILPHARAAGVKLAIEPLHPMYAADRCCVVTLGQANDLAEAIGDPLVGVAIDVYHVWWDGALESEIARSAPWLFAFHVCDWRSPFGDMLNDRELMGEGCIDLRGIRTMVENAGFRGDIEVEIFSTKYWAQDQRGYLHRIVEAYRAHVLHTDEREVVPCP